MRPTDRRQQFRDPPQDAEAIRLRRVDRALAKLAKPVKLEALVAWIEELIASGDYDLDSHRLLRPVRHPLTGRVENPDP